VFRSRKIYFMLAVQMVGNVLDKRPLSWTTRMEAQRLSRTHHASTQTNPAVQPRHCRLPTNRVPQSPPPPNADALYIHGILFLLPSHARSQGNGPLPHPLPRLRQQDRHQGRTERYQTRRLVLQVIQCKFHPKSHDLLVLRAEGGICCVAHGKWGTNCIPCCCYSARSRPVPTVYCQ
jgi:hypothetical protein